MPITKPSSQELWWAEATGFEVEGIVQSAQSSPGYLHVGQVPSNWTRQIPQTSSSGMSHRQDATAFHSLIVTFIVGGDFLHVCY